MTVPKQRTPSNNLAPNETAQEESVAEETKTNSAAEPAGTTESADQQVALATEQPVPSVPEQKISQYVVTVDNQTGLIEKVEELTAAGERKELSQQEYEQAALLTAYYQGVADYLMNLT